MKLNVRENQSEALDAESTTTEDSTAIVSLYNSWTASECGSLPPTEDNEEGHAVRVKIADQNGKQHLVLAKRQTVLEQLKKRCREEDLPAELKIRPRKRPNCVFLNYLGRSRERIIQIRPVPTTSDVKLNRNDNSFLISQDSFSRATSDELDPCSLLICGTQLPPIDSLDYDYLDGDLFDEL